LPQSHTHLSLRLWVRLAAYRLDARLAAGDDPSTEAALACRSAQLLSKRTRRRIARGLERVSSESPERSLTSAAVPCDWQAVKIARPAIQQLARAIRSRDSIQPQGVALSKVLLTEPCSALYCPAYSSELYEVAREALFALLPQQAADTTPEVRHERHRAQA
jgi:hypothetical protein